jgi:hypothetical protein
MPDMEDMVRAPVAFDAPRGDILALFGEAYFQAGGEDQAMTVEPNYLRPSSPEERLMGGGQRSEIRR